MPDRRRPRAGILVAAALAATAAVLPRAGAEPTTTPTAGAGFPSDSQGFTGTAARCGDGQTLMEFGRTSRALVAICVGADGQLEYRGVRLSDREGLTLPATRGADGAVIATNDDVTYSVSKELLLVSEGDTVLYRDTWAEFHTPRFPASGSPSTSAAASSSATASSSTAPATTTVSTTTVTLTPSSQSPKRDG